MVLLSILNELRNKLNYQLSIIHINHGIRPVETDLDEEFVQSAANMLNLSFYSKKLEGLKASSSEEALRGSRYEAFEEIAQQKKINTIATAHHLNDQLETFLMRLYTGATLNGLTGIPRRRSLYIRPLIGITRNELEEFARKNEISYREDQSNFENNRLRNRIRNKITPQLEETFTQRFYTGFSKSIDELNDVSKEYSALLQNQFKEIASVDSELVSVPSNSFKNLNLSRRRHLIVYCIFPHFGLNSYLELKNYLSFETFINTAQTGSLFHLTDSLIVEKDREQLYFFLASSEIRYNKELFPGKDVSAGRNIISINAVSYESFKRDKSRDSEYVCGDGLQFPLQIKSWNEGDWFIPLGMNNRKKLSDFFIDEKVSLYQKKKIPILWNKDEIVWIAGYQIDDRYKVQENCKSVYCLTLKKEN